MGLKLKNLEYGIIKVSELKILKLKAVDDDAAVILV